MILCHKIYATLFHNSFFFLYIRYISGLMVIAMLVIVLLLFDCNQVSLSSILCFLSQGANEASLPVSR